MSDNFTPPLESVILLLAEQSEKFTNMKVISININISPSNMFSSFIISKVTENLENNPDLFNETINYLDLVNLYSIMHFSNPSFIIETIKETIILSRTVQNHEKTFYNSISTDYYYNTRKDLEELLNNNPSFIAFYIYSMVSFITE